MIPILGTVGINHNTPEQEPGKKVNIFFRFLSEAIGKWKALPQTERLTYFALILADAFTAFVLFISSLKLSFFEFPINWPTPGWLSFIIVMHFVLPVFLRALAFYEKNFLKRR